MDSPLISVLIPTYNVSRFIREAIGSVLNQTYTALEVIIVDDCSTDNTYEILKELAGVDQRIKLFKNDSNKKIAETLNFALKQVSGRFIARMDGDDISAANRIERQYSYLMANPHLDLVGLNYIIIDEEGQEIQREVNLVGFDQIKNATKFVSPVPHFWLAKKEVYDRVGDYRIPGAEDYDFILRTIDLGFKVSNVPEFLYFYRMRNGNTATASGLIQKKSFYYIQRLHKERASSGSNTDSFTSEILKERLKVSAFQKFFYRISAQCNHRYIVNKRKHKYLSFFLSLAAICFSPGFIGREKYNRYRYKRLLRKIG